MHVLLLLILITQIKGIMVCEKNKVPLEVGEWKSYLKHLDSAVVENKPVSISEGQIYVYDNYFPGYTIKYIHVDNLAVKTCGANAAIKSGGINTSSVLLVLHANAHQEIRSIVNIWGVKVAQEVKKKPLSPAELKTAKELKNAKSLYLFKGLRTVNHNHGFLPSSGGQI